MLCLNVWIARFVYFGLLYLLCVCFLFGCLLVVGCCLLRVACFRLCLGSFLVGCLLCFVCFACYACGSLCGWCLRCVLLVCSFLSYASVVICGLISAIAGLLLVVYLVRVCFCWMRLVC